ncbi:acyltransferase [Caenimonas soli]|uniref:acyltransferase n=1 Tax=Caenimonas soli TaxID=2735555 RepID=UPI0015572F89|nr:acyltransferase family protein [Caenimonas soli]NPC55770.1 acyltransferase family protein [Caenimonas soli]
MDRRLSLLRVLACFMVVMLHVSGQVFGTWDGRWWAGNVYDSLVRSCVPLFFMIAGASLLRVDEPLRVFFGKRFLRIVPPLLLWSVFYLWWLHRNGVATGNWALAILKGPTMFHLWYFYALVGLYALVPVLRKFHQHSTRREQGWFIAVWLVVASLIPTAQNLLFNLHCEGYIAFDRLPVTYHLSYFGGYVGYLMLGAYIAEGKAGRTTGFAIFLAASVATMAGNYLLSRHFGKSCDFFLVYLSPFVVAAAYGLFSAVMAMRPGAPSKLLSTLADCSLGIYGLHVFVIDPLFQRKGWTAAAGNPWLVTPAVAAGVFVVSFAIIFAVRLIKPARRFV